MILVLDNYDSFTYNLVHLVAASDDDVRVFRNDALSVQDISDLAPHGILISPGPGRPEDAGIVLDVIQSFDKTIPIFGVCLGLQAIGMAYGGDVVHAPTLMHGKTSLISHSGNGVFSGIDNNFVATRYHSLCVSEESLPDELEITARTPDGVIMGLRHRDREVEGIQFHPESILTVSGPALIANWLVRVGQRAGMGR